MARRIRALDSGSIIGSDAARNVQHSCSRDRHTRRNPVEFRGRLVRWANAVTADGGPMEAGAAHGQLLRRLLLCYAAGSRNDGYRVRYRSSVYSLYRQRTAGNTQLVFNSIYRTYPIWTQTRAYEQFASLVA